MAHFFQYQLRTTDADAARVFYRAVLGHTDANIVPLHEPSIARGARPHWLGYLDVGEVERAAAAFVARGAIPLGPTWTNPQGLEAAVMRDPGGAVVALAKPPPAGDGPPSASVPGVDVVWHLLNTADVERAKTNYAEVFGWALEKPLDVGGHGVFHPFAFQPGGAVVGSMSDIADRPAVHPHWLFHFRVAALEPSLDAVRAGGGTVVGPFALPNGDNVAICDDPQGAAFALHQLRRPTA